MIQAKLLSQWQADKLLNGKYKGFFQGEYRIDGHLRAGSMCTVYLARDLAKKRMVAIKVLYHSYAGNERYVAHFKREAIVSAALIHPNIARVYDHGQFGDALYCIVMEHIDGRDLQQIVDEDGPLAAAKAAEYIAQAALGLQHCHEAGLIHRDVKAANLLVDQQQRIKLFDFGLARFSETGADSPCEFSNDAVVGTANYIPPEQVRNSQTVDCRADVYSLGCTLYFLLTGQPPFPHGTISERLLKHVNEEPQRICDYRSDVPVDLVSFCQRMMSKCPDDRIQSAGLVAQHLTADYLR